ncbi:MAG TPA: G/U mismatch-specific DNA glycosylase [Gemmatimonadales bacterium]|nr:G/U mismatch-specific DNA glycosylase [Gemmatimonadales bacterium]
MPRAESFRRPTRSEVLAAAGGTVPDLVGPGLGVLFCGINPSLYSSAVGYHFARPGNRFWRTLHAAGFTERLLAPWEGDRLLASGYGITNLVSRASASAAELASAELRAGRIRLERKVGRLAPRWVAILGIGAYASAFRVVRPRVGRQEERLAGAGLWLLPNPSGLNANHQLPELAEAFAALRVAPETP